MPRQTLIYHTGALGDFVTIEPCLRAYRRLAPGVRLTYLGRYEYGRFGCAVGLFEESLDIDQAAFASLFSTSPARVLLERLGRFDAAIVFAECDSPVLTTLRRAGITRIHAQAPFPGGTEHVVDYHLSLFPQAPRTDELRRPSFAAENTGGAPSPGSGPVAVHSGSGSARKNWPLKRFHEVAGRMGDDGHEVLWLVGPAEAVDNARAGAGTPVRVGLESLVRLLRRCRLYIGNDAGVTHLAAAAGCPTLALFGPSDPRVWAPRGPAVRILRSKTRAMGDIGTATVLRAARVMLEGRCVVEPGVFWHPEP